MRCPISTSANAMLRCPVLTPATLLPGVRRHDAYRGRIPVPNPIALRARYDMAGTDPLCAATSDVKFGKYRAVEKVPSPYRATRAPCAVSQIWNTLLSVLCYAPAVRCPVLTSGVLIPGATGRRSRAQYQARRSGRYDPTP
eukprot:1627013-Rhodomonas_salina.1